MFDAVGDYPRVATNRQAGVFLALAESVETSFSLIRELRQESRAGLFVQPEAAA